MGKQQEKEEQMKEIERWRLKKGDYFLFCPQTGGGNEIPILPGRVFVDDKLKLVSDVYGGTILPDAKIVKIISEEQYNNFTELIKIKKILTQVESRFNRLLKAFLEEPLEK
jgi:hypothetical protein